MRVKTIASAALGTIAVCIAVTAAQAAPAGSAMGVLGNNTVQSSAVERATYGYGWRDHHGRRSSGYKYGYGYGWRPHYYKHYSWKPYYGYGWKHHYGWKRHYGKYSYRYRGYDWQ
jgi:hypothetical protein